MATEIRKVTDSIICMRRASYLTCSYMVRTVAGLVLVDAGMDSDGEEIHTGLKAIGAQVSEIRAILLTHWHNDHSAGAQVIQQQSGAEIYYHRADEPYFTGKAGAKGVRKWLSDLIPEMGVLVLAKGLLGESTPKPVAATRFVEGGERVLEDFLVIATPGHTAGHVSFWYEPEKALFAGDALAVIGSDVRFMARPVTEDHAAARQSMIQCLELGPRLICPGHREPLTEGVENACSRMLAHLRSGGKWPLLG